MRMRTEMTISSKSECACGCRVRFREAGEKVARGELSRDASHDVPPSFHFTTRPSLRRYLRDDEDEWIPDMILLSSTVWSSIVTVALVDVIPISSRARTGPSGFAWRRTRVMYSLGIQTFTPTLILYTEFKDPSCVTRFIEKAESCRKRYEVGVLRETA